MGPPGRFSTDHQYVYVNDPSSTGARRTVPLVAGEHDNHLRARRNRLYAAVTDYTLEFSVCAEVYGRIRPCPHHRAGTARAARRVRPGVQQLFAIGGDHRVDLRHEGDGDSRERGRRDRHREGDGPHSLALDTSLWDSRVPATLFANPSRWPPSNDGFDIFHAVAASDYFAEPVKSQVAAHLPRSLTERFSA